MNTWALMTHASPSSAPPAMTRRCFTRPTTLSTQSFGRSSPANPALTEPHPLSMTTGCRASGSMLRSREPLLMVLHRNCQDRTGR